MNLKRKLLSGIVGVSSIVASTTTLIACSDNQKYICVGISRINEMYPGTFTINDNSIVGYDVNKLTNFFSNNVGYDGINTEDIETISSTALQNLPKIIKSLELQHVKNIGKSGLDGSKSLKYINAPELIQVDEEAFSNNTYLNEMRAPKLQEIGAKAFLNNYALKQITLPELTSLGNSTFDGCRSLEYFSAGSNFQTMGTLTFNGCDSLNTISIPVDNPYIGAFTDEVSSTRTTQIDVSKPGFLYNLSTLPAPAENVSITNFAPLHVLTKNDWIIPSKILNYDVIGIAQNAFQNANFVNLIISDSITTIGNNAFNGCPNLETITLGANIQTISTNAFSGSSSLLKSISLPESNNYFGLFTFVNDSTLVPTISKDVPGFLHTKPSSNFTLNPILQITNPNLIIPNTLNTGAQTVSVTGLTNSIFANNTNIQNVVFPSSISTVPSSAFNGASNLQEADLSHIVTVNSAAFQNTSLKKLTLGSSLKTIATGVFSNLNLTEINLPIDNANFVLINQNGEKVDTISSAIPGFMINKTDLPSTPGETIGIKQYVHLSTSEIIIPDYIDGHRVAYIANPANTPVYDNIGSFSYAPVTKITTGTYLTEIWGSAFRTLNSLEEIRCTNVTQIYESAFESNTKLTKVSLPKIQKLNWEAFEFANNIKEMEIDASVDPNQSGFDIGQIFNSNASAAQNGKFINIGPNGDYKDAWLNKLCGGGAHRGWTWADD